MKNTSVVGMVMVFVLCAPMLLHNALLKVGLVQADGVLLRAGLVSEFSQTWGCGIGLLCLVLIAVSEILEIARLQLAKMRPPS